MESFSIEEALRFGWIKTKEHWLFFAGVVALLAVVYALPAVFDALFKSGNTLSFFVSVIAWFLEIVMAIGAIRIALRIYDGRPVGFGDLFASYDLFIPYLAGSLLYGLSVLIGLVLLIIPGIIAAVMLQFFSYRIVDQDLGPWQALRESRLMTRGNRWKLFWFGVLLGIINVCGVLLLGIGLFVTIPVTMMAVVHVYRKLLTHIELASQNNTKSAMTA